MKYVREEFISAKVISAEIVDEIYIFGVSNGNYDQHVYFIVQQSVEEDLDNDDECFEASFVDGTHYNVVKSISIDKRVIVVTVEDEEEVIVITALCDCAIDVSEVYKFLSRMLARTDVLLSFNPDI